MIKRFISTALLATCYVALFSQNSTIVLFRPSAGSSDKFFLRTWIGITPVDSLPAGESIFFSAKDEDYLTIRCEIENYASWPAAKLKITLIDKDTSFIQVDIKKDAFGNPCVKLKLVPRSEGLANINGQTRYASNSEESTANEDNGHLRSGTGFLVSSLGYVVTNYHVIEGAKKILIKNLASNKDSSLEATVFLRDEGNDLAILKVDSKNSKFEPVPFVIKNTPADLGEKIMVYGYPITTKMGRDVKLTNGIISSVNGFKGDANSYQISAPVQPGNSGGPVFDEKGNLLGIINAKLFNAENATYAIKASYLANALQGIPDYKNEVTESTLWKLSTTEQAKILQRLVYIIEVR